MEADFGGGVERDALAKVVVGFVEEREVVEATGDLFGERLFGEAEASDFVLGHLSHVPRTDQPINISTYDDYAALTEVRFV